MLHDFQSQIIKGDIFYLVPTFSGHILGASHHAVKKQRKLQQVISEQPVSVTTNVSNRAFRGFQPPAFKLSQLTQSGGEIHCISTKPCSKYRIVEGRIWRQWELEEMINLFHVFPSDKHLLTSQTIHCCWGGGWLAGINPYFKILTYVIKYQ